MALRDLQGADSVLSGTSARGAPQDGVTLDLTQELPETTNAKGPVLP